MSEKEKENNNRGVVKGLLIMFGIGAIIALLVVGIVVLAGASTGSSTTSSSVSQGNHDGDGKLLSRSANNGDITVDYKLDLNNFGEEIIILPQRDIKGLEITISFLDKNKKVLDSVVKRIGNVKSGVQVSYSISLFDVGFSVAWNTEYSRIAVTGGTVSYFS